ncbi:hypothetical protein [Streptomyces sp. PA5.6]|uniref:hypothetical protein n=1 Tax=Streptomyces sp. PA5.6 TaxID=3035651 RepID=UPI003904DC88
MVEHDADQEHDAEPSRAAAQPRPATREMTAGLRDAMDDVRRSVVVTAVRVRDAHGARVRVPPGMEGRTAMRKAR